MLKLLILFLVALLPGCAHQDWRTADRSSAGIAPDPASEPQAIVHVYAARAFNWRGYFAVHSWIATKEKEAHDYTTYHVISFRLRRTGTVVAIEKDIPDRHWFGAKPFLIQELRGEAAERAIPKIKAAAENYPYKSFYRAWPGPNSNTFISYIIRHVPELGVELPSSAIGKDWLPEGSILSFSETGTGAQLSIFGVFGLTLGLGDGVEINILGLSFGLDLWRPALKLPIIGRIGFPDAPVFQPIE